MQGTTLQFKREFEIVFFAIYHPRLPPFRHLPRDVFIIAAHLNDAWISSRVCPLVSGTNNMSKASVKVHTTQYSVNVPTTISR